MSKSGRSRNIENFFVLWLDSSISEINEDTQNSKTQLRRIVNSIETFTNADRCLEFIIEIEKEKVFLIISGSLCQNLICILNDLVQIESIYIFCRNQSKHELWANQHRKIKGVFSAIEPICQILKQDVHQSEMNLIPMSIISNVSSQLNELDQTFMYSQLLKETILESVYNLSNKNELIRFCREQYAENLDELKVIDEFERDYPYPSPIWWYTRECFLYSMLNKALRTQDIETIIKLAFFIQDLHRHIESLHLKNNQIRQRFTVFRGQGMSIKDFEKIKKTNGSLLSFNNFLSTTLRKDVSRTYAHNATKNTDLIAVIFRMEIDPTVSSTVFTSVDHWSYYSHFEKEILFSMHTVFRVDQCEQLENNLWLINLILTTDHDRQLTQLTEHMRKEIDGETGLHRMEKLMISMGEFRHAERIYLTLFEIIPRYNRSQRIGIYHQLGYINEQIGQLSQAQTFYEKSLELALSYLSITDPKLAATYTGLAIVFRRQGDLENALKYFTRALHCDSQLAEANPLEVAAHHNNIGGILITQKKLTEALKHFQSALELKLQNLPSNHSSLATTYNNIGSLYFSMKNYSLALGFYEKTFEIEQKSLPNHHPSLAITHINIATVYDGLRQYQQAIEHIRQAIQISSHSFQSDHPRIETYQQYLVRCQRKLNSSERISISRMKK